ncbi:uncharacterized protein [Diabrotica undecimpunctata]|uniref:uncharacterized protein n=1 Tax=Diabrotica undecimpunctata TaxID=50387 RepID=UPI003B642550
MEKTADLTADMNLLRLFFNFGKFIGIIPLYHSTTKMWKKCLSIFYVTVLTVTIFTVYITSAVDRREMYKKMRLVHVVVDVLITFATSIFILFCRLIPFTNYDRFSEIYEISAQIERNFSHTNFKVGRWEMTWIYFRMIFLHLMYIGIHIYEFFIKIRWAQNFIYIILYLPSLIAIYHKLFIINLVIKVNSVVLVRYEFIKKCIEINTTKYKLSVGSLELSKKTLTTDECFVNFKILYQLVHTLNEIFAWPIFLILACTVLETLTVINFMNSVLNWSEIILDCAYAATYIMSTIIIVRSCDTVEKMAKDTLMSCYIQQESLKGTEFEQELLQFVNLSNAFLPVYNAGFVTLNLQVLSSLFSATLTYLIVIIQFDLTLK